MGLDKRSEPFANWKWCNCFTKLKWAKTHTDWENLHLRVAPLECWGCTSCTIWMKWCHLNGSRGPLIYTQWGFRIYINIQRGRWWDGHNANIEPYLCHLADPCRIPVPLPRKCPPLINRLRTISSFSSILTRAKYQNFDANIGYSCNILLYYAGKWIIQYADDVCCMVYRYPPLISMADPANISGHPIISFIMIISCDVATMFQRYVSRILPIVFSACTNHVFLLKNSASKYRWNVLF